MFNRAFQSVVFNSGQQMVLRAFYIIRALTIALAYYYINRSKRHLSAAIENNCLEGPIIFRRMHRKSFYHFDRNYLVFR